MQSVKTEHCNYLIVGSEFGGNLFSSSYGIVDVKKHFCHNRLFAEYSDLHLICNNVK